MANLGNESWFARSALSFGDQMRTIQAKRAENPIIKMNENLINNCINEIKDTMTDLVECEIYDYTFTVKLKDIVWYKSVPVNVHYSIIYREIIRRIKDDDLNAMAKSDIDLDHCQINIYL